MIVPAQKLPLHSTEGYQLFAFVHVASIYFVMQKFIFFDIF